MEAVDDNTFRLRLKQPSRRCCSRWARAARRAVHHAGADRRDRSVQADHRICRLRPDALQEGRMGARRQGGVRDGSTAMCRARKRATWLSGGKRIHFDRIEWQIIPDRPPPRPRCRTARSTGWKRRCPIWCRCCKKNRNISVDIADPLGNIGSFRINHLYPPFNDVRARRAVQIALSQEDYMGAWSATTTRCGRRCRASSRRTRRSIPKRR